MNLQDESQIDEVIGKLSALLTGGVETVRTDRDFKEQIRLLQKKQKNLHLMCVKEQAKVDQIQMDIADIQASSSEHEGRRRNKQKNNRRKNNKMNQNNLDLNALEEEIAQLREESEHLDIEGKEITQQVIDSQDQLADAKQELNAKYDNLIHFEEEFDSCGKQLALLKAQCDEKIAHWESIRQATKHAEKEKIDIEISRNQAVLQVQNLKETQEKIELQMQLYEQLTARLSDQIDQNQSQVTELSAVNAQLEQKLANIADHPQQLRQVLQMSALMLNHKTQLLDSQIVKIKELENGRKGNNDDNEGNNEDMQPSSQKSINSDSSSLSEQSNDVDKNTSQEEDSSSRD